MTTHEQSDRRFVDDRRWRNRFARPAVGAVIVFWLGLCAWLVVWVPLLVNPLTVAERMRGGTMDTATQATLAALCPVAFDIVGVVVLVFLVFSYLWIGIERRYLSIVDR